MAALALPLSVALMLLPGSWGLRLTELTGPRYPDKGDDVTLTCNFDTGPDKLYSVKWYKDENEFFRFMPSFYPQQQVFPLKGISLDVSESGINHVRLSGVGFSSSGSYSCEVSTEAPSFETVFLNHSMTVLAYPQGEPAMSGVQDVLSAGDLVAVNCTAPPSHPPPQITFYTNNDKADDWLVERGPLVVLDDGTAVLRFHAERQHFLPPDGALQVRCEVTAPPLLPAAATRHLYLAGFSANQKLAQHTYRNSGAAVAALVALLVLSLTLTIS